MGETENVALQVDAITMMSLSRETVRALEKASRGIETVPNYDAQIFHIPRSLIGVTVFPDLLPGVTIVDPAQGRDDG